MSDVLTRLEHHIKEAVNTGSGSHLDAALDIARELVHQRDSLTEVNEQARQMLKWTLGYIDPYKHVAAVDICEFLGVDPAELQHQHETAWERAERLTEENERKMKALKEAHAVALGSLTAVVRNRNDSDHAAFDHITGILRRALSPIDPPLGQEERQ